MHEKLIIYYILIYSILELNTYFGSDLLSLEEHVAMIYVCCDSSSTQ